MFVRVRIGACSTYTQTCKLVRVYRHICVFACMQGYCVNVCERKCLRVLPSRFCLVLELERKRESNCTSEVSSRKSYLRKSSVSYGL